MRIEQSKLLCALVENEISRLLVWANPTNEPNREPDEPAWDSLVTPVRASPMDQGASGCLSYLGCLGETRSNRLESGTWRSSQHGRALQKFDGGQ